MSQTPGARCGERGSLIKVGRCGESHCGESTSGEFRWRAPALRSRDRLPRIVNRRRSTRSSARPGAKLCGRNQRASDILPISGRFRRTEQELIPGNHDQSSPRSIGKGVTTVARDTRTLSSVHVHSYALPRTWATLASGAVSRNGSQSHTSPKCKREMTSKASSLALRACMNRPAPHFQCERRLDESTNSNCDSRCGRSYGTTIDRLRPQ